MKYDKDEKKLKPEMKLPGDAWMDHVEKNHNASAANPITVEGGQKGKWATDVQQRLNDAEKKINDISKNREKTKNIDNDRDK